MLMIAECSSQVRQWEVTFRADDPAIRRTQYMPGVGHHMWNGLDGSDQRAAAVITAFLQDKPAPLPNYPTSQPSSVTTSRRANGASYRGGSQATASIAAKVLS